MGFNMDKNGYKHYQYHHVSLAKETEVDEDSKEECTLALKGDGPEKEEKETYYWEGWKWEWEDALALYEVKVLEKKLKRYFFAIKILKIWIGLAAVVLLRILVLS